MGGRGRQQSAHQEQHRHHRQRHRRQGRHEETRHDVGDDQPQGCGKDLYRLAQILLVGQGLGRSVSGCRSLPPGVLLPHRRGFGVTFDLSGVTVQKAVQHAVADYKHRNAEAQTGKGRQAGHLLGHAKGEGIEGGCRKAKTGGQGAHAQTGEGVPAQGVRQQNDDGHQCHQLLENTENRAEQHEKQG